MSTPAYLIAHRALPIQAHSRPAELWEELSGPEWSSWLAMIGMKLQIPVRHIGIEGAARGKPTVWLEGIEMLAMYFPKPEAPGEPYFAILARRGGETKLHSYVFEQGGASPEKPQSVVMAEWRLRGPDDLERIRFDAASDASLEACLVRVVIEMKNVPLEPVAALNRKKLLPKLRHERWIGWTELPSRPLLPLSIKGLPHVAAGMDTRERFQFVQHSDLDESTTLADLEAIAVANLGRRSEFWTVKEKSKGFLGIGAKPTFLELIAEHAAARILDTAFLEMAHEQLNAPLLAVAIPFRGVLWARSAAGSAQDIAAFAEGARRAFTEVPRGVEPISPHVFTLLNGKVTGVILRDGDKAGDLEPTGGFPWPLRPV